MRISDVLNECSEQIARTASRRWPPAYRLEDGQRFHHAVSRLARRPFPAQYHVACALATALRKHRGAFLVGEPGAGKTMVAITTAAVLRARRVLVLAPAHLLGEDGKWAREIRSTIPTARVIELTRLSDVDRLHKIHASPDQPLWVLLSRDRAKLGSPWRPAYLPVYLLRMPSGQLVPVPTSQDIPDRLRKMLLHSDNQDEPETYVACASCGDILRQTMADGTVRITPASTVRRRQTCSSCGEPMWSAERTASGRASYPIGLYLARRARKLFDLLVVDESHDYKGAGTAQGIMLSSLAHAARATLAITATLTSGRASSLFYLLHRVSPAFRLAYPYRQPSLFVSTYGSYERTRTTSDLVTVTESGTVTRKQIVKSSIREKPGLHPGILSLLVDRTAFIHIVDLGANLPPYREAVHRARMLPEQAQQYKQLHDTLADHIACAARERRASLLGCYLQAMLSLPDAPWRGELVRNPETGEVIATIDPLPADNVYPKEQLLVDLIRGEKSRGRKTLVYVTHTGARDISARLRQVLSASGIRAEVLPSSVPPRSREQWLARAVRSADVVISSPRLVGSGLDLLDFSSIVWVEPEYSTYTVRQASRRTWRLGQTRPVNVHFLVYENTLQDTALALVARGILAASIVDGELSTEEKLAALGQDDSILFELARTIAEASQAREDAAELLRRASLAEAARASLLGYDGWVKPEAPHGQQPAPRRQPAPAPTAPARVEQIMLF